MEEYEVNLADYLRVLWRGKWIVIIITVAAVAAGIIFSLNIPSLYQARTQLMIMPMIAEDVVNAEEMRPLLLAPETYRRLATARDLLREVGDAVYGPGEIAVEALANRMQMTIDGVGAFSLLTMTVIGSDPQVAADLAATWARLFMERSSAFMMSRITRSYDFIAATFAEVQTDLSAKEEERKVFERKNPRDLLVAELDALQSLHQQNMTLLEEKRNSLAAEEARIVQIKEEWAETEPVIVLHQGLDLRELGPSSPEN